MKKYYARCVESENKIKKSNSLNKKLSIEIFNQKMKFIQKSGFMYRDDFDKEFGLSNN
jgi:hypothetical protein